MTIIILLGVVQGFIVSMVLWSKNGRNKTANQILALFICFLSLVNLEDYLVASRQIFSLPHLYAVFSPLIFTLAPLFYFYIKQICGSLNNFKPVYLLHIIPWFLLTLLLGFTFYFQNTPVKKALIFEDLNTGDNNLLTYAMALQSAVYVILSVRLIVKYNHHIKHSFSYNEGITLKRQLFLLIILISMWLFWGVEKIFLPGKASHIDDIFFTLFIYSFGYAGLLQRQVTLAPQVPLTKTLAHLTDNPVDKPLPNADALTLYKQLLDYMETHKPYLQKELGIQGLADMMSIGVNQLSQLINSIGGQNFFDFVNSYRVEEFKQQLLNPNNRHFTLLAIAYDCGFNSKAAFNNLFKKKTGMTPSQYKATLLPV